MNAIQAFFAMMDIIDIAIASAIGLVFVVLLIIIIWIRPR